MQKSAFKLRDTTALTKLEIGITRANANYALHIQGHISASDSQSMWKGMETVTSYNKRDVECPRNPCLPDDLNTFYACFEVSKTSPSPGLILLPGELPPSVSAEGSLL